MGSNVKEIEARLSAFLNAKYVLAVNTGISALHVALVVAGIGQGDEVIVPFLTFVAAVQLTDAMGFIGSVVEIFLR
jgi:dTDP-4-amino-4,6-dideoxygalactose transaminase